MKSYDIIEVIPINGEKSIKVKSYTYKAIKNASLICLWYFFSTTLSVMNNLLMSKSKGLYSHGGGFPAPLLLTGLQFFVQYILSYLFLETNLVSRSQNNPNENRTWKEYFKTVIPNGISTGLDIGFSNLSLQTISLSFYTMCKSTTPMFLLLFSFVMKLETPTWNLAGVIAIIYIGVCLLVYGETEFHIVGFLLVMAAACLAGFRWALTQILLQGNSKNNDTTTHDEGSNSPLEALEQLLPVMSFTLILISLSVENVISLPSSLYFITIERTIKTIIVCLLLAIIAFLMVWTEFKVIKETSSLTFIVAGMFKEIITITAAVLFFGESFGLVNAIGLSILIFGVSLYNYYKYQKMQNQDYAPSGNSKIKYSNLAVSETSMVELNIKKNDNSAED